MSDPRVVTPQEAQSLLDVTLHVVAQADLAEIDERRRIATTAHPFDHARWVQANAQLIASDVPALVFTVATEPDRTRAAVVKAIRTWLEDDDSPFTLRQWVDAIENGGAEW